MTEIRRDDRTTRRQALILVVVGAVTGAVLLLALEVYEDPLLDWLRSELRERMTIVFSLVAAMLSGPVLALAVYLWLLAARDCFWSVMLGVLVVGTLRSCLEQPESGAIGLVLCGRSL